MWSISLERFEYVYHESTAMTTYRWIMRILTVFGTALLAIVTGSFVFQAWWKATESWVLQYDFLWENAGLQNMGNRGLIDYSKAWACSSLGGWPSSCVGSLGCLRRG